MPTSDARITPPRGFEDWLEQLIPLGMAENFDADTAAWFRVIAATRSPAVVLATGSGTVPYVDWFLDGMSMSSRLILHNQSTEKTDVLRAHFSTDIRVATHQQGLDEFLEDIEDHRFDFIIIDLDAVGQALAATLIERMFEHGLFVCLGDPSSLDRLIEFSTDTHFHAPASADGRCMVLSRKSLQHRAVRRGGRRRHSPG